MGLAREQDLEIYAPPVFKPGARVRAMRHIKNDGTVAGREVGEVLIRKGDIGYVRDIGTYLQRFYVYAVEFVDRRSVIGMRAHELADAETAP